jgi:hypothetical protein
MHAQDMHMCIEVCVVRYYVSEFEQHVKSIIIKHKNLSINKVVSIGSGPRDIARIG